MAEKEWLYGFLRRIKSCEFKASEPTSTFRASGFNRMQVKRYFELLAEVMSTNDIAPNRIFNLKELNGRL